MTKFKFGVMIVSCIGLSGCASLQLVSLGASGLSYMVTGKSISDHAISTVMKKDCALHRSVFGQETCTEYDGDGVIRGVKPGQQPMFGQGDNWQIAATNNRALPPINHPQKQQSKTTQQRKPVATFKRSSVSPDTVVRQLMAEKQQFQTSAKPQTDVVEVSKLNPQPSLMVSPYIDKPALFAVVGSYNNKHFAQGNIAKQAKQANTKAKLMINSVELIQRGAPKYRVVIGPILESQFSTSLGDVGENTNHKAWRMTLCQQTLSPPPCENNMLVAAQ